MVDDDFLITKRTSAESVGQGLSLLSMDNWVSNTHDTRLSGCGIVLWIVPFVLEEAFLSMLHMTVYVSVSRWGGEGKRIWSESYDVSLRGVSGDGSHRDLADVDNDTTDHTCGEGPS